MPRGSSNKKTVMVGVGLDSDGHKRVTAGDNFVVAGGTKDTHDQMTEKVVKINEKLTERGKCLNTVEQAEFKDIAESVGLKEQPPENPENN
ncbi:MAG TPA: hypothetical protein QGG93_07475 [Verrucomicrobiota bacterium]|nr:hypothetical protein [Verrucomicrobiota bacterium]